MVKTELDRRIFDHLKRKLNGKISETTIRPAISRIRSKNPSLTLNVAAEVFAKRYELSVQRFFNDKDREVLKTTRIDVVKAKKIQPKNKLIEIAKYDTDDNLLKRHLEEINKTYTYKCYTSTFIICRKVLENLIIHHIIRKKYSSNSKQDKEKYYDINRGRYLDFSKLISNLRDSAKDFQTDKKLVERICDLSDGFVDEANDMTHSLYHVASRSELKEKNYQQILDLVSDLEKKIV